MSVDSLLLKTFLMASRETQLKIYSICQFTRHFHFTFISAFETVKKDPSLTIIMIRDADNDEVEIPSTPLEYRRLSLYTLYDNVT